ncbi:hypothetical protein DPMN_172690 [Dreissena polymorpha]|uniref:Uncharacterized protein n=1 Tax=Dreissena polymorpha TaxID=45954 RepID=A0A9D4E3D5_DREPO|nr:hypothetical protein DPMN_172690 [Dreissena polymorpha]
MTICLIYWLIVGCFATTLRLPDCSVARCPARVCPEPYTPPGRCCPVCSTPRRPDCSVVYCALLGCLGSEYTPPGQCCPVCRGR